MAGHRQNDKAVKGTFQRLSQAKCTSDCTGNQGLLEIGFYIGTCEYKRYGDGDQAHAIRENREIQHKNTLLHLT